METRKHSSGSLSGAILNALYVYKDQSRRKNVESLMEIEDVNPDRYKKILKCKELHDQHNLILRTMIIRLDAYPYRIIYSALGLGGNHTDLWHCGCTRTYRILYTPGGRLSHDEKCVPCTQHKKLFSDFFPADTSTAQHKLQREEICLTEDTCSKPKTTPQITLDRFFR